MNKRKISWKQWETNNSFFFFFFFKGGRMTEDVFLTQCLTQLSRLTCGSPQHVKINTTPLNEVLAVVCVSSPQPWRRHPRGEGYQGQAGRSEKTPDTNRSGGEAVVSLKIGPKTYYAGKRSHVSECLIEARGKTHLFCSASIKQLESPQVCLPHSGIVGDGAARPLLLFSWLRKKKKEERQISDLMLRYRSCLFIPGGWFRAFGCIVWKSGHWFILRFG